MWNFFCSNVITIIFSKTTFPFIRSPIAIPAILWPVICILHHIHGISPPPAYLQRSENPSSEYPVLLWHNTRRILRICPRHPRMVLLTGKSSGGCSWQRHGNLTPPRISPSRPFRRKYHYPCMFHCPAGCCPAFQNRFGPAPYLTVRFLISTK